MDLETIQQIGTTLGTTIATLLVCLVTIKKTLDKYLSEKKEVPKKIAKQSDIDTSILNNMERAKEVLKADRILVFDFHNGEHYANGRSALRMSASYEVSRYGIERKQQTLQRIPLSFLPNLVNNLLKKDEFKIIDFDECREIQPEYSLCVNLKMKSFYNYILKNEAGDPVGFISIQFTEMTSEIDEEEAKKLVWFVEEKIKELI